MENLTSFYKEIVTMEPNMRTWRRRNNTQELKTFINYFMHHTVVLADKVNSISIKYLSCIIGMTLWCFPFQKFLGGKEEKVYVRDRVRNNVWDIIIPHAQKEKKIPFFYVIFQIYFDWLRFICKWFFKFWWKSSDFFLGKFNKSH